AGGHLGAAVRSRYGRGTHPGPLVIVLVLLAGLQFYARPRLWDGPTSPDFLRIALLLLAIRTSPGVAAVIGLLLGLVADVLTPAHFGAGMLAHTLVGYLGSQGRAVVFAENILVTAGLFAGGLWLRNAVMLVLGGTDRGELTQALLVWSPLQATTTALAGLVVVVLFRDWLAIRIDE
ncbi:MAG: rod shape-determining protein MreD, partial [Gemmatimonadales bacterium]|nr:rod shape-determining protein MreD [Gemmatimonadales bacterium]